MESVTLCRRPRSRRRRMRFQKSTGSFARRPGGWDRQVAAAAPESTAARAAGASFLVQSLRTKLGRRRCPLTGKHRSQQCRQHEPAQASTKETSERNVGRNRFTSKLELAGVIKGKS